MKLFHYLALVCQIFGATFVICSDIIEKERHIYPSKMIYLPSFESEQIWACCMDVSNCDKWNCDKWKVGRDHLVQYNEYASRNNIIYRVLGKGQLMVLDTYGNEIIKILHPFNASAFERLPHITVVYKGYLYTTFWTKFYKCAMNGTEMCPEFMDDDRFISVKEIKFHKQYIYMRYYGGIKRCSNFSACEVLYSSQSISSFSPMAFHAESLYIVEWSEHPAKPYLRRCNIDTMSCYTLDFDTAGIVIESIGSLYVYRKSIYIVTSLPPIDAFPVYWKCNLPNATACQRIKLNDFEIFHDKFTISYSSVQMLPKFREEDTRCSWQPAIVCPLDYVTYENDNAHLQLSVSRDGKLIDADGALFDTSNAGYTMQYNGTVKMRTAIFTMDNGGSIYASNYHAPYKYHQSSLMAGKPVSSAGVLQVSNGEVKFVSSCSTHYQVPPQIAEQFVDSLIAQGYNASVVTMVHNCTYETLAKSYHAFIGDPGPFVHMSSISATLLSKLISSFKRIYENESRNTEMLAAACAVGVASSFGAPIGGVLFSIEVTTVYFAVRNYWRGFFSSVCGATVFRLLAVWFNKADTVKAFFPTYFTMEYPFDPQELTVFAFIGVVCGFGGAFYVWAHRHYVLVMRKNKKLNSFLQKNRFLYPAFVTFMVATVSFPLGLGKYCASDLSTDEQFAGLFSNFTWTKDEFTIKEAEVLEHWSTDHTNVFVSLIGYLLFYFVFSIISSTIPVPSGSFIPVFKVGAAFGRIIGELLHIQFPNGFRHGKYIYSVVPGGYATVGAAAFSGAVTHSISVSVIAFEMTGQITHIIPMMMAVLIANAIAALLQPSLYDSIILIKKLPYLPDLLPSNSSIYSVYVEDFMLRNIVFIWKNMTYKDLKRILKMNKRLRIFPLVENPESMILLGSVQRLELIKIIEDHVGRERRVQVVAKWQKEAQERLEELERRRRQETHRRPSRFEVTPAPDILKMKQHSSSDLLQNGEHLSYERQLPKKSILKKTNSFNLRSFPNLVNSSLNTPYSTVTGAESRIRLAFEAIFHKSATLQDANPELEMNTTNIVEKPVPSPTTNKKVQLPRERVIDMSPEDQREWEEVEMEQRVNFDRCHIDPAPFQLVERTSLLKVHSIFSLVGVNQAYVTAIGRLVGVVGLKELRKAIEDSNSGILANMSSPTSQPSTNHLHNNIESKSTLLQPEQKNSDTTSVNSALTNNDNNV